MSVNMKTRHLTVDIFLIHKSDGILSPHILPPSPPPNKAVWDKDGHPFPVAYSSPEPDGQSVCFRCPFVLSWCLLVGCRAIIVGIRLPVPFKRWPLTEVCVLCVQFPRHPFRGTGGAGFDVTPRILPGTDLHMYGLGMDGWPQGVPEEHEPSSFSEVRALRSNTQVSSGKAFPHR